MFLIAIAAAVLALACTPGSLTPYVSPQVVQGAIPVLTGVFPASGYPRQVIGIEGTLRVGDHYVWDRGLASETSSDVPDGKGEYAQIPALAPGGHTLTIVNSNGASAPASVTVLAPAPSAFPAPRIEDVGILYLDANGRVWLVVTAANMDRNARVTVNGNTPTPYPWGALPVDFLLTHKPETFVYPVYHYSQMLCDLGNVTLGSTLSITVTNRDGLAASTTYTLPATVADLDSDGDGLLDSWETGNYTAPSGGTVPLAAMGADRHHKDVLVEVDWMASAAPDASIWGTIVATFANSPVLNVDGSQGVNMIIDHGQGGQFTGGGTVLADHAWMDFGPSTQPDYANYWDYKTSSFNRDRTNVFHYVVFGLARPDYRSGWSEFWGNDLMVTLVSNYNASPKAQTGTFIHEIGHNFGLRHGGVYTPSDESTYKPNMASVMDYRWQVTGASVDCDWISDGWFGYSLGYYATINEAAVSETNGLCDNTPLDMNGDGVISPNMAIDFSNMVPANPSPTTILPDFDQWGSLRLNFRLPGSGWAGN